MLSLASTTQLELCDRHPSAGGSITSITRGGHGGEPETLSQTIKSLETWVRRSHRRAQMTFHARAGGGAAARERRPSIFHILVLCTYDLCLAESCKSSGCHCPLLYFVTTIVLAGNAGLSYCSRCHGCFGKPDGGGICIGFGGGHGRSSAAGDHPLTSKFCPLQSPRSPSLPPPPPYAIATRMR